MASYPLWTLYFVIASMIVTILAGLLARLFVFRLDEDDERNKTSPSYHVRPQIKADWFESDIEPRR